MVGNASCRRRNAEASEASEARQKQRNYFEC